MPRLLRIITRLNVGGPATHVQLADRELEARGWETLLVFGSVEADEAEATLDKALPAVHIPALRRRLNLARDAHSFAELVRLIRGYRPDVIHTHLSKAGLLGRSAALALPRAQRIHTFHGNVFDGYFRPAVGRTILAAERGLARMTHRIVALSELQRDELRALHIGSPERIAVIPLAIDLQRFAGIGREDARRSLSIPTDAIAVLAVGRMVAIKRLDRLVRAFARVAHQVPSAHLYLVGDGPERPQIERLTRSLAVDNVTFVGWSADTPRWYGAADVVALSSSREGTPLALIEAAASGRPVVATRVGGVPDVVRDGVTGVIVDEAGEGLSQALEGLLRDPTRRSEMGKAALSASIRYGASRLGDDLDHLYRSLVASTK